MKGGASWRVSLAAGAIVASAASCGGDDRIDVERVAAAYDGLAARAGWPGFDGSGVPLAIFDGTRTWLLRHPDPPPEFGRHGEASDLWVHEGRHPAAAANTSEELGGFRTAVVLAEAGGRRPAELARTLVHEAFHVFQDRHHPEWAPNEVELLTYPVEDAEALRRRRLETAALRRALRSEAPDSVRRACWLRAWLAVRRDRLARLPEGAAAYERAAELREGLARYVEATAAGEGTPGIPADGYPPEAVRVRAYAVGHALGWLLDRTAEGWKERLEAGEAASLEDAVADAVSDGEGRACRLTPDESARALAVARADLRALAERRAERLRRFQEAPGWRVEIVAPDTAPLFPEAFDPQNVDRVGERLVLHGRWLRLRGEGWSVEVLGRDALTEGVGPHPLFTGVGRFLVSGLPAPPEAEMDGGSLRIRADGLTADLAGASLLRSGQSWRVEQGGGGG